MLATIIGTALDQMAKTHTSSLKLSNLEVLMNAILYNPPAALHIMEADPARPGLLRVFFDKWFAQIKDDLHLPRVHDKKLCVLALCALLELHPSLIPPVLKDGWPGILAGCLRIFVDFPKSIEGDSSVHFVPSLP